MRDLARDAAAKRETKKASQAFKPNAAAEAQFHRALKQVAKNSGHIVDLHVSGSTIKNAAEMQRSLDAYAKALGPWAEAQVGKLLAGVAKKNKRAFEAKSKVMSVELKAGVAEQQVGKTAASLMAEQVALIQSIPQEAGQRAQKLALQAIYDGTRSDEIAQALLDTTNVTVSRATLIARTETARANASITQARATAVGAEWYIWETTMDGAERDSHRKMNGKPIRYDDPPTLIDRTKGHAGTFPRCRCWQNAQFGPYPGK